MKLTRLTLTTELRERIRAVEDALDSYVPGLDAGSVVELPKLALADALLAALAAQESRRATTAATLAALPKPRPAVVVEVSLRPKRRRA